MSNMENFRIEQLWYTWSDVGLSSIHAGFRIRAASPGLTEIYSERVKSMDRYMRYTLPPTTNGVAITPEMAPVNLTFIRTDWNNEYILVHKNYSGKDGVGRPGNFFVHVLALGAHSASLSVEDAIWLWDADFWKTNDQTLDRRSNSLDIIPARVLDNTQRFSPQFMQVRNALPFIIEAFLSRRERAPLYIAAPAHQAASIAYLIAGLVSCLPKQLLADLTFSTYESDVTKATTEIVGTSWIATPGMEREAVFSEQFYREKLAINCFTGERSPLQKHPQAIYNPLAADFATYATECLVTNNMDQLIELCELAEKSRGLQCDSFLQLYSDEIANTDSIGIAEIERYLSDPDLRIDRLSSRNFRKKIIECAVANPQWCQSRLGSILHKLRMLAEREATNAPATLTPTMHTTPTQEPMPTAGATQGFLKRSQRNQTNAQTKKTQMTLASGLTLLAERAIPEIVDALKKAWAAKGTTPGQPGNADIEKQKAEQATVLIHLMSWCIPSQNASDIWKQLFDKITESRTATEYVKIHWDIDLLLLERWNEAFPINPADDHVVRPLVIVPWQRLGKFLKAGLRKRHRQWNIFAVERLTTDMSLTPPIAQALGKRYVHEIDDLLTQLLQDEQIASAAAFLTRLVEKDYPQSALNDSFITALLTSLLEDNQHWLVAQELVTVLTRAGYRGNILYLEQIEKLIGLLLKTTAGQDLLDLLIERGYPRKKQLVDLLLTSSRDLESSVIRVYRTAEEQNEFFLREGHYYLQTANHIQALLSLYQKLLRALPIDGKLDRLFVLLAASLDEKTDASLDDKMIEQLLRQPLDTDEQFRILEHYGKLYLQECYQMPALADMVVEWFTRLPAQYNKCNLLFKLLTSQTNFQYQEPLLKATQFSLPESRKFFKEFGHSKDYFPLFYRSPTILTLFTQLARYANETSQDGQIVAEKMQLLFIWLRPSPQSNLYIVKQFLEAAALSPEEQIAFLEDYGDHYISTYPELPILMEYLDTYMQAFNAASLEQEGSMHFFTALVHQYKHLSLPDEKTRRQIQYWYTIHTYCSTPSCEREVLVKLATALYKPPTDKAPPDDARLIAKLVSAFVSCIRTDNDLNNIVESMSQIQLLKDRIPQLLYEIAEQAAVKFQQSMLAEEFLPYIVFALTWSEGIPHFVCVFLDTLLYHVKENHISAWKILNECIMQQHILHDAIERWRLYLRNLEILDLLATDKSRENIPSSYKKM